MIDALSFSQRIRIPKSKICSHCLQQTRNATLLRRPKRPYTFTQLVTLTDGSSYLHRTTSPQPVYRTTKDVRNSLMWNPSNQKLWNMEEDEAGKLAAFRSKFGESYDAKQPVDGIQEPKKTSENENEGWDSLMDMISTAGSQTSGSLTKSKSEMANGAKNKKT